MPSQDRRPPLRWPDVPDVPIHRLKREALEGVQVILPLYLLLHLVAPTTPGGLGLLATLASNLCAWVLTPLLGLCLVGALFARTDRSLRDLLPVCALGLLSSLMLRDVFNALA